MVAKSAVSKSNTKPEVETKRTAVLLIHGIGNQAPLETLRGFVDGAWWQNPENKNQEDRQLWVKPAEQIGEFELRRMTSSAGADGKRTDFYEFYWAHLMEATRFLAVLVWLKRLFHRRFGRVPENVTAIWASCIFLITLVVIAIRNLYKYWNEINQFIASMPLVSSPIVFWLASMALVIGVLWYLKRQVFMQVVGDATCYLTADPENIAARSRIRSSGVSLLNQLQKDPRYDRIVVVGHSLGTVVGYDILAIHWSEQVKALHLKNPDAILAIKDVENKADDLRKSAEVVAREKALKAYNAAQDFYFETLQTGTEAVWKVTDFVTLGSPLTYASFLLVDDGKELSAPDSDRLEKSEFSKWIKNILPERHVKVANVFAARVAERTFQVSPPLPDQPDKTSFCYKTNEFGKEQLLPHHATAFAAIKWTNIYAPARWLLWGDVIGGPVAPLFGPGVKDIALTGTIAQSKFAHTKYWDTKTHGGDVTHLKVLWDTLKL